MTNYTSPADEAFFAAIGRLTLSWAQLEAGLDFAILIIHESLGGKTLFDKPRSLKTKLKYLKNTSQKIPALKECGQAIINLMDRIDEASVMRHDLTHGFITSHPPEGLTEVQMVRLQHNFDPPIEKPFKVTPENILIHANKVNKLAEESLGLAWALQQDFLNTAPKILNES